MAATSIKALVMSMFLAGLIFAGTATAMSSPFKCSYGAARKADCARDATRIAVRGWLNRKAGQTGLSPVPVQCTTHDKKLLRWTCSWQATGTPAGAAAVVWKATSNGWTVHVTAA